MKFSVEVRRTTHNYVRIEVEADNYSQADTYAMELAKHMEPEHFTEKSCMPPKLSVSSTDRRDDG